MSTFRDHALLVATVITLVLSLSSGPAPLAPSAGASAAEINQCSLIQRKLYVSTGSGTVRLRDGNYVSPPITLARSGSRWYFHCLVRVKIRSTMSLRSNEVLARS